MSNVAKIVPSPAYLRKRLRYDSKTGKLYWRFFPQRRDCWNARYAETEAFTTMGSHGYRTGSIDGVRYLAHRVAWTVFYGEWPPAEIDHEDHDKSNNRMVNLKASGYVGNNRNKLKDARNSSGVVGVYFDKRYGYWEAKIKYNYKSIHLGCFADFDSAVTARKEAEKRYGFHPNHGAFARGE